METLTLEKQQTEIIKKIYNNIDKSGDREYGYPSNDWSLSHQLKELLGEEGRVSFPVEAVVGEDAAERFIQQERSSFLYFATQLFSASLILRWLSEGVLTTDDFLTWMKEHGATEEHCLGFKEFIVKNNIDVISGYAPSESFYKIYMIPIKDGGFAKPEHRKVLVPTFRMFHRPIIHVEPTDSDDKRLAKMSVRKYTQFLLKHFYKSLLPKISREPEFGKRLKCFEEALTALEQKMSQVPARQKGQIYISALPEDILTASINSRSWTSCLGEDGCNWAAPYHYVQSGSVAVAFFIPDGSKSKITTLSDALSRRVSEDVSFFNKTWRQFFVVSEGLSILNVTKAYPYQSEDLTKNIANFLSAKALSLKPELSSKHIVYTRKNTYLESTKTILGNPEERYAHVQGRCPSCNSTEMGDDSANSLLCASCAPDSPVCERCGDFTSEDDATYVEDYGHVCSYCLSNTDFTYCYEAECYYYDVHTVELMGDSYFVDNLHRSGYTLENQNGHVSPLYSPTFILRRDIEQIAEVVREGLSLGLYSYFNEEDIIRLYKHGELMFEFEL